MDERSFASNSMYEYDMPTGSLMALTVCIFTYNWYVLHGGALTRARRAFLSVASVLDTYQYVHFTHLIDLMKRLEHFWPFLLGTCIWTRTFDRQYILIRFGPGTDETKNSFYFVTWHQLHSFSFITRQLHYFNLNFI